MGHLKNKPLGVWIIIVLTFLSLISYIVDMPTIFSAMSKYNFYEILLIIRIIKVVIHSTLIFYLFKMLKKSIRMAQITFGVIIILNIAWRVIASFIHDSTFVKSMPLSFWIQIFISIIYWIIIINYLKKIKPLLH